MSLVWPHANAAGCCDALAPRTFSYPVSSGRTRFDRECRSGGEVASAANFRSITKPLPELLQQRDEFALPMRIGLGEHGFQLVARRLARNLQFPGGDIG